MTTESYRSHSAHPFEQTDEAALQVSERLSNGTLRPIQRVKNREADKNNGGTSEGKCGP